MPIRVKFLAAFLCLATLIVAAIGAFAYLLGGGMVAREQAGRLGAIAAMYRDRVDGEASGGAFSDVRVRRILSDAAVLGTTGEIVVVSHDADGSYTLVSPRRFDPGATVPRKLDSRAMRAVENMATGSQDSFRTDLRDDAGEPVYAASVYDASLGWGFVVAVRQSEAQGPFRLAFYEIFGLGLVVALALAALFGLLAARLCLEPIRSLTRTVIAISRGDAKAAVPPKLKRAKGEIGDMARALDLASASMKLALHPSYDVFAEARPKEVPEL